MDMDSSSLCPFLFQTTLLVCLFFNLWKCNKNSISPSSSPHQWQGKMCTALVSVELSLTTSTALMCDRADINNKVQYLGRWDDHFKLKSERYLQFKGRAEQMYCPLHQTRGAQYHYSLFLSLSHTRSCTHTYTHTHPPPLSLTPAPLSQRVKHGFTPDNHMLNIVKMVQPWEQKCNTSWLRAQGSSKRENFTMFPSQN